MAFQFTRRRLALSMLSVPLLASCAGRAMMSSRRVSVVEFGAQADGTTINTRFIQAGIDQIAGSGGGTLVVPRGVFVSGALFLKPGVNLHLDEGAVIRCTTDMTHFPPQRTRIEGHFEEKFTPALINAKGCDGLRITGQGTLDGAGMPIWEKFWALRNAAPNPHEFPNLGVPRARLALLEESKGVLVEGVTFKDSQFWNLHIYKCEDVTVRGARFTVPDDYKQAPSSDGIDLDSCRQVVIDGCYFSVTDDCVAAKGTKGVRALEDKDSPPVEHIRIRNCHFRRGHHALACGSEATIIRDVVMEDCRVDGDMVLARLKLRPDTPQTYEDITFRNITLDNDRGTIVAVQPWSQYVNLDGAPPPQSTVRNISFIGIKGRFGGFGTIAPNPGQTRISDILFQDVDVRLGRGKLEASSVERLRLESVRVNGQPVSA